MLNIVCPLKEKPIIALTGMEILELKEEIGEKEKDFLAKEKELNWLYETSMAEASGNIKASQKYDFLQIWCG